MSYPKEAKNVRATHRFYPSQVRFLGTIPHGKSTREIAMDVDPELILRIADALRATDGGRACHNDRQPTDPDPYGSIGHAMWHVENPEHVMPCLDNHTIIDMDTLAAGCTKDEFVCTECSRKLSYDEACHSSVCHDCSGCSNPLGTPALPAGASEDA